MTSLSHFRDLHAPTSSICTVGMTLESVVLEMAMDGRWRIYGREGACWIDIGDDVGAVSRLNARNSGYWIMSLLFQCSWMVLETHFSTSNLV